MSDTDSFVRRGCTNTNILHFSWIWGNVPIVPFSKMSGFNDDNKLQKGSNFFYVLPFPLTNRSFLFVGTLVCFLLKKSCKKHFHVMSLPLSVCKMGEMKMLVCDIHTQCVRKTTKQQNETVCVCVNKLDWERRICFEYEYTQKCECLQSLREFVSLFMLLTARIIK